MREIRQDRGRKAAFAFSLAVLCLASVFPGAAQAKNPVTKTKAFLYTGAEQAWTVPSGVSSIHVFAVGGRGGDGGGFSLHGPGGRSSLVAADLPVQPGQTLYVEVGGDGTFSTPGFNGGGLGSPGQGGGGGGASDLRTVPRADSGSAASRLIVAGGGGGGAIGEFLQFSTQGAAGGGAGQSGGNGSAMPQGYCAGASGGSGGTTDGPGGGGLGASWGGSFASPGAEGDVDQYLQPAPGTGGFGGGGPGSLYPVSDGGGGGGGGFHGGGGGGAGGDWPTPAPGCHGFAGGGGGGSNLGQVLDPSTSFSPLVAIMFRPPDVTPAATVQPSGLRAAALKKCTKKKSKKARRKCRKRAKRLPV
jgi:hypothetical protein